MLKVYIDILSWPQQHVNQPSPIEDNAEPRECRGLDVGYLFQNPLFLSIVKNFNGSSNSPSRCCGEVDY